MSSVLRGKSPGVHYLAPRELEWRSLPRIQCSTMAVEHVGCLKPLVVRAKKVVHYSGDWMVLVAWQLNIQSHEVSVPLSNRWTNKRSSNTKPSLSRSTSSNRDVSFSRINKLELFMISSYIGGKGHSKQILKNIWPSKGLPENWQPPCWDWHQKQLRRQCELMNNNYIEYTTTCFLSSDHELKNIKKNVQ